MISRVRYDTIRKEEIREKTILKMVACILVLSLSLTVLQPLAVFAEQNISSVETMQEKWVPSEEDKRTIPLSL